jgi:hypothetical protein
LDPVARVLIVAEAAGLSTVAPWDESPKGHDLEKTVTLNFGAVLLV